MTDSDRGKRLHGPAQSPAKPGGDGNPGYDPSAFEPAFAAVRGKAPVVMVLGGAGTGKTTFLHALRQERDCPQVFLAPTGVAALQLGGQTLHSCFGLPPRIMSAADLRLGGRQRALLARIGRVVIDEISMVRSDLLDLVDRALRIARKTGEPFGGVQMVLVGDFLQLPPVVPQRDREILEHMGYPGPYAFNSVALGNTDVSHVVLRQVHRQTDPEFIAALDEIRCGGSVREAIEMINERCVGPHRPGRMPVLLTPTNARGDTLNREGLDRLEGTGRTYVGKVEGDFGADRLPAPEALVLKVGARVMAVRNDPERRWVNGSLGTVRALASNGVEVRLDSGEDVDIEPATWEKIRYDWEEDREKVASTVTGTFTQLPLVPAWAVTVHKAQGLTLSDVRVDFHSGAFAPGQAYVALSRSRSLEGLSLVRPMRTSDVRVDRRILEFMQDVA